MSPNNNRVLLISYYFPPMGLGGVQRALAIARYLMDFGREVLVITSNPDHYPILDQSLADILPENLRVISVSDPISFGSSEKNKDEFVLRKRNDILRRIVRIPDIHLFWVNKAYHQLHDKIKDFDPGWIISTSPPPSVHFLAQRLKKYLNSKWIADFRDPWSGDNKTHLTILHNYMNKKMESSVVNSADSIITVTAEHGVDLKQRYPALSNKIVHIPNGYDPSDFENVSETLPEKFIIAHGGTLINHKYTKQFIEAVSLIANKSEEFRQNHLFKQIGSMTDDIHRLLISREYSNINVEQTGYLNHYETLNNLASSTALIVFSGESNGPELNIPGKLYEALYFNKPLLTMFRPLSPGTKVVADMSGVYQLNPNDPEQIKAQLMDLFQKYLNGQLKQVSRRDMIEDYSRKAETHRMLEIMEKT